MVDEDEDGETCEPCYRRALANGHGDPKGKRQQIREKKALKTKENGPKTLKKVQKRLVVLKARKREKTGKKQKLFSLSGVQRVTVTSLLSFQHESN
jgi:hypothetical protein